MIGKTISHYKILEKLGEGGMGVVYKAEDTHLRRLVALKFLPRELTKDADARERFAQEARAASMLDHPHICNIHDIDETDDGQMYIVMAYYEGESLRKKIDKGGTGIREAIDIVLQVAEGLDRAHKNDIIHRDIKPANIVITRDNEVKIVDFGLAKLMGQSKVTKTGTTLGTVRYMSPEQITGGDVDHRSDIWSIGVVLYELIAGKVPYEGDYDQSIAYSIVNEPHERLGQLRPGVPRELDEVIQKTLAKHPGDRLQDIASLISELRSIRRRMDMTSTRYPVRARRMNRMLVWGMIGVVVLTAVSVLYSWKSKKSGEGKVPDIEPSQGEFRGATELGLPRMALKQVTFSEHLEEYPAFSPEGTSIAYCRELDGHKHVFITDLKSGAERQITQGRHDNVQPSWSADGYTLAFVRSNRADGKIEFSDVFGKSFGGDIWTYSLDSDKQMKILENAYNPSFSPDGERIAFDSEWSKTRRIWVADRLGRNPQQITFDPSEAVSHIIPRWSPDGGKIVFQNMDWTKFDVKLVDIETKAMQWVTDDSFQDLNPVWARSGNNILFSSYRTGGLNIWRIPVSGDGSLAGQPRPVTTGAGQDVQLAISPDGSRLAFSILKLNADIWRLPVSPQNGRAAGDPQQVIATTREDSRGAWSPDRSAIAFNSDRSGDMNIWIHSLEDGSTKQLTKGPGGDYQANWSPDGKTVAFFSARAGNPDIWVVIVATGELKQLTHNSSLDINPFFSPSGHHIAYQSDQDGRKEVWVMKADGSNQMRLTAIGVSGHFMRWSPTGRDIYFASPSIKAQEGTRWLSRVARGGGEPAEFVRVMGSSHISFSPRYDLIMDVVGHKQLWVSYVSSNDFREVFEFEDPDVRIDYPVWSPDGQWVLFDYLKPGGGDIWIMEGFEERR